MSFRNNPYGYEMIVKYNPPRPFYMAEDENKGFYSLEFKASLIAPEANFDAERYRRAFVEAMDRIARLEARD